jgi:F0F1-type ATP synthase membrane subunit b/b'
MQLLQIDSSDQSQLFAIAAVAVIINAVIFYYTIKTAVINAIDGRLKEIVEQLKANTKN